MLKLLGKLFFKRYENKSTLQLIIYIYILKIYIIWKFKLNFQLRFLFGFISISGSVTNMDQEPLR